ncbi:MAG: 6-phosphofructokinase, partial [Bacteroidetes bacterium HGW-Bacteroidetes-22]
VLNIDYGAVIISEGVFHFLSDEEILKTGITFTFDDHGHPELGNVSKAHIFNMLVQQRLRELKIPIKSRPVELGYELRCVRPIGFDLMYCNLLGLGVKVLFDQGHTACMVTSDPVGDIFPLFLKDVADEKGKVKPRLVNIYSQKARMVYEGNIQCIQKQDYEAASVFVSNPAEYDFYKILNWEKPGY